MTETNDKPRKRWTNWAPGDFWLQLATVIIGIAVTFGGSSLMEKRSERKRNYFVLATVRDELQANLDRLLFLGERLDYEHRGAIVLRPFIDNPEGIPADSLEKYLSVIAGVRTFGPEDNAFEMMKNSSQTLTPDNMSLVRDMFYIYGQMVKFNERLERYNRPKLSILDDISSTPHLAHEEALKSPRQAFIELLKFPAIRGFVVTTAIGDKDTYALRTAADSLMTQIPRVIDEINMEVGK
jgi:hypothetical protein